LALNSFMADISDQYHDLDPERVVNLVEVHSHHLEFGNNLQGMLEAYQIDGVPGIKDWFNHVAQNLSTPEGIPLPFAEALQQATGLTAQQAIQWLTANLIDVAEIGAEAAIIAFFRKNPKAYSICLVLGIAFGFYNDNPLLVAMNGLLYFNKLRREGRLQKGLWNSAERFLKTSFNVVDKVCTTTFVANTAFSLTGASLPGLAEHLATAFGLGSKAVKTAHFALDAASAADLVEGAANFGLSLVVGKAVGKIVEKGNQGVKDEISTLEPQVQSRRRLIELIKKQVPPETLAPVIELMEEDGVYQPLLS
jgi:hypothetical protein